MSRPLVVGSTQRSLVEIVERLSTEYDGVIAAGTVMRCVAECREALGASAADDLAGDVERMARRLLVDRAAPTSV